MAATCSCLLAAAAPASAKLYSVGSLRISGPGIDKPIDIGPRRLTPNNQWDHRIYLSRELLHGYPLEPPLGNGSLIVGEGPARLPSNDLGPRYKLSFTLDFYVDRLEHVSVVQHLYPFARPEPFAFTPPGQSIPHVEGGRDPVPYGWQSYSPRALGVLRELGLPEKAPAMPVTGTAPHPASPPGAPAGDGVVITVIGAALAGAGLTRRRKPSPA
ncbi:MAG: hypothetical protein M3285_06090 [Actinomycetota bacterium]|nr:hypothetical protein [Actinomycetota bacterium]